MGTVNLGKVRGNMWYVGSGITGHDTTPTIFPDSGVSKAYVGDLYLHLEPGSNDNGHIYSCEEKGEASDAKWAYAGSILGPQPDLYDGLDSSSTITGSTANAVRKLKKLIDNAGIYPKKLNIDTSEMGYIATLTIENTTTEIQLKDEDGNIGTYSYTAAGVNEDATVTINIGTEIGFAQEGAVIAEVSSSSACIKECVITGSDGVICDITPDIWTTLDELSGELIPGQTISVMTDDETYLYRAASLYKLIAGTQTKVFPISLSKAIWAEEENGDTVYDRLKSVKEITEMAEANHYIASITDDDGTVIVDDDSNETAGDWRYQVM